MGLLEPFAVLSSLLASLLRFGAGASAAPVKIDQPIIFYEFEGCPFCRIAREAVSEAGVPVLVRPCPKTGDRFRPRVKQEGGKSQFPYLVDPNTDTRLYESGDIAAYLLKTYGAKSRPIIHWLGPLNLFSSQLATMVRLMSGTLKKTSVPPEKPMQFFGAERHASARLVKELLCVMQIEYFWRSRDEQETASPALYDPNTGEAIKGSRAIRAYLKKTYR